MRDQKVYCQDILDRIQRIERYADAGHEAFLCSELVQDAVIRNFEVIGEIVKRLDEPLIADFPEVMWSDFAGFRDVLIHQYNKVRIDLVWEFARDDLPALKAAIAAILSSMDI